MIKMEGNRLFMSSRGTVLGVPRLELVKGEAGGCGAFEPWRRVSREEA